jgi:hypothetical protein
MRVARAMYGRCKSVSGYACLNLLQCRASWRVSDPDPSFRRRELSSIKMTRKYASCFSRRRRFPLSHPMTARTWIDFSGQDAVVLSCGE